MKYLNKIYKSKYLKYLLFLIPVIVIYYYIMDYLEQEQISKKRLEQAKIDAINDQIANSGGLNSDGSDRYDKSDSTGASNVFKKTAVGTSTGAAIGGTVGSVVPVVGTAIGGAVGAVIGAAVGTGIGVYEENEAFRKMLYKIDVSAPENWSDLGRTLGL